MVYTYHLVFLSIIIYQVQVSDAFSINQHHSSIVPLSSTNSKRRCTSKQQCIRKININIYIQTRTIQYASPQQEDDIDIKNNNWLNFGQTSEDDNEADTTTKNNEAENKFGLGQSSYAKYGRPKDIDESSFGPLLPIAEAVDEATGGWGLSYADLHPVTPQTTVGQAFLATNFFYALSGLWLGINGDWFYGGLTEIAGIVSFVYHYTQLDFGKNRSEVRLALLIDYFCAGAALITGGVYMISAGITSIPLEALIAAGVSGICLSLCWVWEFGYPYIFWHSLWHIFSAYTGYLVGQEHLATIAAGG